MTERQDQRSGDSSLNIQAGQDITLAIGITYEDARAIAQDVFNSNFLAMRSDAAAEAQSRAREILDKLLARLRSTGTDPSAMARDPDLQFAIFDAQKAYARSGDPDLADVLIDILENRSREEQRTTHQLVLNEAVLVAPKLNKHHFDLLTIVFVLRSLKFILPDRRQLFDRLALTLEPFSHDLRLEDSSFSHLQYAGCGSLVFITEFRLGPLLIQTYPEIFPVPHTSPEPLNAFREHNELLNRVAEYWEESVIKNFTPTTVGTAIGHAHLRARFRDARLAALEGWIK
jgi:hypothetical protein